MTTSQAAKQAREIVQDHILFDLVNKDTRSEYGKKYVENPAALEKRIASALTSARDQERERCAKMVEGWFDGTTPHLRSVVLQQPNMILQYAADAIRQRVRCEEA